MDNKISIVWAATITFIAVGLFVCIAWIKSVPDTIESLLKQSVFLKIISVVGVIYAIILLSTLSSLNTGMITLLSIILCYVFERLRSK